MRQKLFRLLAPLFLFASCASQPNQESPKYELDSLYWSDPPMPAAIACHSIRFVEQKAKPISDLTYVFDFGDGKGILRTKLPSIFYIFDKPGIYQMQTWLEVKNVRASEIDKYAVTVAENSQCRANMASRTYLVRISMPKPSGNQAAQAQTNPIEDVKGQVLRNYPETGLVLASLSDDQVRILSEDSRVVGISTPQSYTLDGLPPDWHIQRIYKRQLPLAPAVKRLATGKGVVIFVLDTAPLTSHTEIAGKVELISGASDPCNHGTAVSSLLVGQSLGIAPDAKILSIPIFPCSDGIKIESHSIVEGLQKILNVVKERAIPRAIVNLSFSTDKVDPALDQAIREVVNSKILVVVSAGNRGTDACKYTPSHLGMEGKVIAVGGVDADDMLFARNGQASSFGSCVSVYAPAQDVMVATADGTTSLFPGTGNSFAAPIVAGAAAVYWELFPNAESSEVRTALLHAATPGIVKNLPEKLTGNLLHVPASWKENPVTPPTPPSPPSPPPDDNPLLVPGGSRITLPDPLWSDASSFVSTGCATYSSDFGSIHECTDIADLAEYTFNGVKAILNDRIKDVEVTPQECEARKKPVRIEFFEDAHFTGRRFTVIFCNAYMGITSESKRFTTWNGALESCTPGSIFNLLASPWKLESPGGISAENRVDLDGKKPVLSGLDSLIIAFNLNGMNLLLPSRDIRHDASALIFDQNTQKGTWKVAGLVNYAQNGSPDLQVLSIPLSHFSGLGDKNLGGTDGGFDGTVLHPELPVNVFHVRFWGPLAFKVEIQNAAVCKINA